MIICIDCVEDSRDLNEHYSRNPDVYPAGECRLCHKIAPLTDGYINSNGGYFDTLGQELHVGDTIAYSVKAGRSSGKMIIGKIYRFGPRTVCVEFDSIDWDAGFNQRTIRTIKTHFNYHPSKCLKIS